MSTLVGLRSLVLLYNVSISLLSILNIYVGKHASTQYINTGRPTCPSPSTLTDPSPQMISQLPPEAGV